MTYPPQQPPPPPWGGSQPSYGPPPPGPPPDGGDWSAIRQVTSARTPAPAAPPQHQPSSPQPPSQQPAVQQPAVQQSAPTPPQRGPQWEFPPAQSRGRGGKIAGLAGGAIVLLAVGAIGGYFVGHHSATDTLDSAKVAAGVTGVLENDYGIANVVNMSCPKQMKVKIDAIYTCTFTAGSANATVDIVVQNDDGQYLVQGPKG